MLVVFLQRCIDIYRKAFKKVLFHFCSQAAVALVRCGERGREVTVDVF